MARAEAHFNKPDYPAALAEYEEVLKFPTEVDLVGLALFKSAWCHWRLGNTDEATKRFVQGLRGHRHGRQRPSTCSQQKALDELQGEALKYLVEVFTEDDKNTAQDMYNFLTKIGGDRFAGKIVRALAETYFDQAHYERGIEAYELLLKLEPTAREAATGCCRSRRATTGSRTTRTSRPPTSARSTGYTRGRPVGAHAGRSGQRRGDHGEDREAAPRARHLPQRQGAEGQDEHRRVRGRRRPLRGVPDASSPRSRRRTRSSTTSPRSTSAGLNKNTDAATHYMNAARGMPDAEIDKNAPGDPLKRHDAIYNAIASLERVRVAELEARKAGKGRSRLETETDKKFAEALDLYSQLYPNDPALPELFFRQGKLYYDYEVYDSAVKLWGTMLEKCPHDRTRRGAGELILDSFVKSKNYENIETVGAQAEDVPEPSRTPSTRRSSTRSSSQPMFKQGEQKAQANDHAGATAAYLRAAKEYPKDPRAAQACSLAEVEAKLAG